MTSKHIFLTGRPGIGKSTAIAKFVELAKMNTKVDVVGFFTRETRGASGREGFEIVTIPRAGEKAVVQRMSSVHISSKHRVGKYGVDVAGIDKALSLMFGEAASASVSAPSSSAPASSSGERKQPSTSPSASAAETKQKTVDKKRVLVIDEVGKMECFSQAFQERVRKALRADREKQLVVGTVGERGGGLMAAVKEDANVEVWTVTAENRNEIPERLMKALQKFTG